VPADGFNEIAPGVWEPEGYLRTKWEIQAPEIRSLKDADEEWLRCAHDGWGLQWFAFHHCWSLDVDDPSGAPQWRKFPLYPYLRRFFEAAQVPSNIHVEKSRQMLLSWAWMVVFLWDILFHDDWGDMVLSRRADEVDDGGAGSTPDSLLGKVRHLWLALPPYLQEPMDFKLGFAKNDGRGSYIRGETGTPKAGRGRANKRALMDEAAYIEKSEAIFKGLRQAAKGGTCLSSTPNGKGNVFARLRFSPTTTFRKLSFHWTEHPRKAAGLYCTCGWQLEAVTPSPEELDRDELLPARDKFLAHECANLRGPALRPPEARSPWYDRECQDLTPEGVASELDISYERSRRGRVFESFDSTRHVLEATPERQERESMDAHRERYLRRVLEPNRPCVVGWDFGVDDPTSLLLGQVIDESSLTIRWVDEYERRDASWDHYHAFVNGLWAPIVNAVTGLDLMHYGDPSGKNRESDLTSWISNLRSREPRIVVIHEPKRGSMLEWLDFLHDLIRKGRFEVSAYCTHLIDAVNNYHWPLDSEGNPVPGKQLPVHDDWSHACSALRYVYQFRYWQRLPDFDRRIVTAGAILRPDDSDYAGERDRQPGDVVRPMDNPKPDPPPRLSYF
jgi:hypothetical protein